MANKIVGAFTSETALKTGAGIVIGGLMLGGLAMAVSMVPTNKVTAPVKKAVEKAAG